MTLEDALRELSLPGESTVAEVRKAYLRLLKVRKPDADPEGFMRLREAYELAMVVLPLRSLKVSVATEGAPEAEPNADFWEEQEDEASTPDAAPPQQVHFELPTLVALPYEDGDPTEIAPLVSAALREAAADPNKAPPLFPMQALLLLARLHERSAFDAASELMDALEGWLAASGGEALLLQDADTLRWVLLRDLWTVRDDLPQNVREALAGSIREGHLENARGTLASFRSRKRRAANACARELQRRAPTLRMWVGDALPEKEPFAWPKLGGRASGSMSPWWLLLIALVGLPQLALLLDAEDTSAGALPYKPKATLIAYSAGSKKTPVDPDDRRTTIELVARTASKLARRDVENLTRSTGSALVQGDCASATGLMVLLREERARFNQTEHAALEPMESQLDTWVQEACHMAPPQWKTR